MFRSLFLSLKNVFSFHSYSTRWATAAALTFSVSSQKAHCEPENHWTRYNLNRMIDHTLLKPEATPDEIHKLCEEAIEHNFFSVCVNSVYVSLASKLLKDTPVKVCCVVGFPLGAQSTTAKVAEAEMAIEDGAQEIDMVLQIGLIKAQQDDIVFNDIQQVARLCHKHNATLKVILETSKLTEEEKVLASIIAAAAGADFVKTSTGFGGGGATVEDVRLMSRAAKTVNPNVQVKASGGVRTRELAEAMFVAGATRLGTSSGVQIVTGESSSREY